MLDDLISSVQPYFGELCPLNRREGRAVWRRWTFQFCRGGGAGWDAIGAGHEHSGESAIRSYTACAPAALHFGAPELGFARGSCTELPPYSVWLELYRQHGDDALYVWSDHWTLAIHHEQFGGLVPGPIWSTAI